MLRDYGVYRISVIATQTCSYRIAFGLLNTLRNSIPVLVIQRPVEELDGL